MTRPRLLTMVAVTAAGLVGIKAIGIATGWEPALAQSSAALQAINQQLPPESRSADELAIRLQERLIELDARDADISFRESLLAAAEAEFQARLAAIESDPAPVEGGAGLSPGQEQLASIVIWFEQMQPRKAASVFDILDMAVMIEVANAMDSRKFALVLEQMSPEAAAALTIAIAQPSAATTGPSMAGANPALLPQIQPAP